MPIKYSIPGSISPPKGVDRAGIKVQAFDRDLPSLERRAGSAPLLLGEAITDLAGRFQITYTLKKFEGNEGISKFRKSRERRADVSFRVLNASDQELEILSIDSPSHPVGPNQILYNVPPKISVTLTIGGPPKVGASEYEQLVARIAPVVDSVPIAELTDEDIVFLLNELELTTDQRHDVPLRLEWLRRCAILAAETKMPPEAFYGWGRKDTPSPLKTLATLNLTKLSSILPKLVVQTAWDLQQILDQAIHENIIPFGIRDRYAEIGAEVERRGAPTVPHPRVSGRLIAVRTGLALANYRIHAQLLVGREGRIDLGTARSNVDGRFDFVDKRLSDIAMMPRREARMALRVFDTEEQLKLNSESSFGIDGDPVMISVSEGDEQLVQPLELEKMATYGGPKVSRQLLTRLSKQGIRTLEDMWKAGGAGKLKELSTHESKSVQLLDAHANLFRLSSDVRANAAVIEKGFTSTLVIAATPADVFYERTREALGDVEAASLYAAARAERHVLNNVLMEMKVREAAGHSSSEDVALVLPQTTKCSCRQCETAASPLAYLVDLLNYAVHHVRLDGDLITVDWLQANFHQPFSDLPIACEAMDKKIRQVRLCVEVLRRHLLGKVLSPAAITLLDAAERDYRIAAYTALLAHVGTSYDELRLTRDADQSTVRIPLAKRLGFSLGVSRPDRLDELLLDPSTLSEADLYQLFGLVDTRIQINSDRLSDGLVHNDSAGQIIRWDLAGIEWHRTTDDEGIVHVTLSRLASGNVQIELYRDEVRAPLALVAGGETSSLTGPVQVTERNESGLYGSIDIRYTTGSSTISLDAVPRILAWRLDQLRLTWTEQDRPSTTGVQPPPPSVDPDLLQPGDLRDALKGPAADLWNARRKDVDDLLDDIRTTRQAEATPANALDAALLHPKSLGQSISAIAALDSQRQAGMDVSPTLLTLQLSLPQFDFIVRLGRLVSSSASGMVLPSEWADLDAILVKVWKLRQADRWRTEEGGDQITLGPDFFRLPVSLPSSPSTQPIELPIWLTTKEERREWERTLKARYDQQLATLAAQQKIIDDTEEATITDLRDALIAAAGIAGGLKTSAAVLTDQLCIDCANGACQITTRIAQAMETVQILLFSLRTEQLSDVYPKLTLSAPDFEREWEWIGSYASWRAAMLVFMYPENVLHPTLRDRQSPGFKRFVRDTRALLEVTPEVACKFATAYSDYFRDICNLNVEASTYAETTIYEGGSSCRHRHAVQVRNILHLFGRTIQGTVYWATFDPVTLPDSYSFWDWIPGLQQERVSEVIGATTYDAPDSSRFMYVFVLTFRQGTEALLYTRYNLEEGIWDTGSAELALPVRGQSVEVRLESHEKFLPPLLIIRQSPGGGEEPIIYRRSLNRAGNGWAEGDWYPQVFSPWGRLSNLTARPGTKIAAASSYPERLDLFKVDVNGGIYHAWWGPPANGGAWSGWTRIGSLSIPPGSPLTVHVRASIVEVFAADSTTNGIWRLEAEVVPDGLQTSSLTRLPLAGPAYGVEENSELTAISAEPDRLLLLLLDKRGVFHWAVREVNGQWNGWFPIGSGMPLFHHPQPIAAAKNLGAVYLWIHEGNDVIRSTGYYDGEMQFWDSKQTSVPLSNGSPISVVARTDLNLDNFVVGSDGSVQSFWASKSSASAPYVYNDKSFRIGTLAVPPRSPIAALARGASHIDLFVVGKEGRIHRTAWDAFQNEGTWNEWTPISSPLETFPLRAPITALQRRPGHIDLFVVGKGGEIYSAWWDQDSNAQWPARPYVVLPPKEYQPIVNSPFVLTEQLTEAELQKRRSDIRTDYINNSTDPALDPAGTHSQRNLDYLDEAYYFLPMLVAQLLQRSKHYVDSLDWYRTIYDYSMPIADRYIAYLLVMNQDWSKAYERSGDWLADPLNPHRIAATRPGAYARYTCMSLIRCFLDYADEEFTQDTNESVPRARTLYLTALELANTCELIPHPNPCEELIAEIDLQLGDGYYLPVWQQERLRLESTNDLKAIQMAVKKLKQSARVQPYKRILAARDIISTARASVHRPHHVSQILHRSALDEQQAHTALLAMPAMESISRSVARGAGAKVMSASMEDYKTETTAVSPILDTMKRPKNPYVPAPSYVFCVPPNHVVRSLILHGELNLYKLRNCRNIAGMERYLDPYTAQTDIESGLPSLSDSGQLIIPKPSYLRPTDYHYSVLVEQAKQLTQLAAQLENSMLSAFEKRDFEAYTVHKARQDADLLRSKARIQDLQIVKAQNGVRLAQLQAERAEIGLTHWQTLLQEGVSSLEQESLASAHLAELLYGYAAVNNYMAANTPNLLSIITFGAENVKDVATALSSVAQVATTASQINAMQASWERRRQDWEYQKRLSQADTLIANQGVVIAQNDLMMAQEEKLITALDADHAAASLEFLSKKFAGVELYEWMGNVLEQVYGNFLKMATAMAKLAATQLSFERQEDLPPFIQLDYWAPPSESTGDSAKSPDRRGVTGSARLLQDIYMLEQHAFQKNARKLHLTKTISFRQMAPIELQRFRETGVLPFATTLQMFDRDFPGDYLRLMKHVRISLTASIPPSQGIRAALSCTGVSRAVVARKDGQMQTVIIRRDPQRVALSTALDATGVFESDPQSELLRPFEGLGVDVQWEFRMPRASNPFPFSGIADVLMTIDYTALHDNDYAKRVMRELGRDVSYERTFSFHNDFNDAWKSIHDTRPGTAKMEGRFETTRNDFASSVDHIVIEQITLVFVLGAGPPLTIILDDLRLFPKSGPPVGGGGATTDGIISTAKGNASMPALINKEPIGTWEISLPNTAQTRSWFTDKRITDIFLIITYRGELPAWPA